MADGSFNRRDFLGMSGGFTGALLGSHVLGGPIPNAHADSPGTSTKPVPPPDLTGRDGIPFVDCSKYRRSPRASACSSHAALFELLTRRA